MNKFRTHKCNELRKEKVGEEVILSGWINKKRDHGNLLFLDLRDHYGLTQCVIDEGKKIFKEIEKLPLETVIQIEGKVLQREKDTINKNLNKQIVKSIIDAWMVDENKVFHLKNDNLKDNVRDFYESIGNMIGNYKWQAYRMGLMSVSYMAT